MLLTGSFIQSVIGDAYWCYYVFPLHRPPLFNSNVFRCLDVIKFS